MDSVSMNNHVEIISSEEPLVEDFDLPDIQGIKSQWESPVQVGVPLPSHKSPAARAREREIQEKQRMKMEQQAPVNREDAETEPEKYDVEMNKLKAQFEKGSKSSGAKSNTSQRKSSLKDSGRFNTKVEVAVVDTSSTIPLTSTPVVNGEIVSYEQQIEEEPIQIDLKNLKSQFEREKTTTAPSPKSRSKKHATSSVKPAAPIPASPIVTSPRQEPGKGDVPIEVIRPGDVVDDTNYEVEMTSLRKMFDKASTTTKKEQKKTKRRTFSSSSATSSTTSSSISHSSLQQQQKPAKVEEIKNEEVVEVIKSSEPLHEEMIGEESVKDRLARYKEVANFKEAAKTPKKKSIRNKQFNASKPRLSSTGDSNEPPPTPTSQASDASSSTLEVIRSSTAGAKEEANYELSVDLKQTKALFESTSSSSTVSRTSTRRSSFKTRRSSSASRSVSPSRSSRSSSTHSYTLKSRDDSDIADTPSDMAEIVRPSPAGTKEVVDVQPSFSISAAKNLFESSKGEKSDVDYSSPRRRQLKSDWATNANKEIPVVKEGSFIDNNARKSKSSSKASSKINVAVVIETENIISDSTGEEEKSVVRPPSAGTKEKPDYQLESNALKARAAIFQQGKANDYKPRNRVQKEEKKVAAEIVNHRNDDESAPAAEEEFVPSIDQKAARSVFENQQEEKVSAPRTVNDVVRASNMNAAKGVFTGEVQSANAQSSSEDEQEEAQQEEEEVVEEVEEVAAVAAEPATFEIEAIVEPVAPEPAVDEKEVEQDTPVVASRETNSSSSSSSVSEADSVDQAEQVAIVDDVADDVQAAELEAQQLQNEGKIGGPDTLGDFFSTPEPTNTNNNEQFSNFDLDTSSMFPVQSDTTITGDPEPATTADLDIMGGDDPFGMNLQPTIMNNNPPPSAGGFGSLDIFASPPPNTPANQTSSSPAPDPFAAFSTPGSDPFSLESKPTSDPFSMGAAEPAAPASADPFDLFGSMSQPPAANNTPAAPTAAGTDPFDLFG